MKKKLQTGFTVVFVIFVIAFLSITAIVDLTNTSDRYTVTIDGGFELLEVEHRVNGLIPIGTDYYYLGIDEETLDCYVIIATKKWGEKNLTEDGYTTAANGLEITGLEKKISDHEISTELVGGLEQVEQSAGTSLSYPLGQTNSLDLTYRQHAYMKLLSAMMILLLSIVGIIYHKKVYEINPVFVKIYVVLLIVAMLLMIFALR